MEQKQEVVRCRKAANLKRRRQRPLLLLGQFALYSERILWRRERPYGSVFWSNVLNNFDEDEWRSHFCMLQTTFDFTLELTKGKLRHKTTNWLQALEPRLRCAVALWWYATPCEYRTLSCVFGIATVCVLVHQVTTVLKRALLKRFVVLPIGSRLQETMDGFAERGYPMCAYIPIIAPNDNSAAYYKHKGWRSIVLQAVVDHNCW